MVRPRCAVRRSAGRRQAQLVQGCCKGFGDALGRLAMVPSRSNRTQVHFRIQSSLASLIGSSADLRVDRAPGGFARSVDAATMAISPVTMRMTDGDTGLPVAAINQVATYGAVPPRSPPNVEEPIEARVPHAAGEDLDHGRAGDARRQTLPGIRPWRRGRRRSRPCSRWRTRRRRKTISVLATAPR